MVERAVVAPVVEVGLAQREVLILVHLVRVGRFFARSQHTDLRSRAGLHVAGVDHVSHHRGEDAIVAGRVGDELVAEVADVLVRVEVHRDFRVAHLVVGMPSLQGAIDQDHAGGNRLLDRHIAIDPVLVEVHENVGDLANLELVDRRVAFRPDRAPPVLERGVSVVTGANVGTMRPGLLDLDLR